MELTGGVLMKSLSISAILMILVAAPVRAGMMTIDEGDQRAQCGLRAARMFINGPEDSVIFPEDATYCRELNGEADSDAKNDSLRLDPANSSAGSERSLEVATLAPGSSN